MQLRPEDEKWFDKLMRDLPADQSETTVESKMPSPVETQEVTPTETLIGEKPAKNEVPLRELNRLARIFAWNASATVMAGLAGFLIYAGLELNREIIFMVAFFLALWSLVLVATGSDD
jgi:hypothetical protein